MNVALDLCQFCKMEGYASNLRIQAGALTALQEGVEAYIVGLFKLKRRQPVCNICQEGYYNALQLAQRIRGHIQLKHDSVTQFVFSGANLQKNSSSLFSLMVLIVQEFSINQLLNRALFIVGSRA